MALKFRLPAAALFIAALIPFFSYAGSSDILEVRNLAYAEMRALPSAFTSSVSHGHLASLPLQPRLEGKAQGVGRFAGRISQTRIVNGEANSYSQPAPLFLRGKIRVRGRTLPMAVSIISYRKGRRDLSVIFELPSVRKQGRRRLVELKASLGKTLPSSARLNVRTRRTSSSRVMHCGLADDIALRNANPQSPKVAAASALRYALISTDTDVEWTNQYGAGSVARVTAIIDAAEVIYMRDLGIAFDIVKQFSGTSYSNSSMEPLLSEFQSSYNKSGALGEAHIYHLFSGKGEPVGAIGLAYLGVVCRMPEYLYGVTRYKSDTANQMLVFAHEVGHNFNASHTTAIMNASLDPTATGFALASIDEITSYLNSYGSCLNSGSNTPIPTPGSGRTPTPTQTATRTPGSGPTQTPQPGATPTSGPNPMPTISDPTPEPSGLPDLKAGSLSVSVIKLSRRSVRVKAYVSNEGNNYAYTSLISVYLGTRSKRSASDRRVFSVRVEALPPHSSGFVSLRLVLPRSAKFGKSYLIAVFDSSNALEEISESNNSKSRRLPRR